MKTTGRDTVLIASGASGGHLFPALAVAQELVQKRGKRPAFDVKVILGGNKFTGIVERFGLPYVRLPAAAFNDRGPLRLMWACMKLLQGFMRALRVVVKTRPVAVFGTGGYATVALMLAAKLRGVPTIIHEANVLPGRANRLLMRFADVMVLTFEDSLPYIESFRGRVVVAGTPLRQEIMAVVNKKRQFEAKGGFRLLVLGGSQGSRIWNDVMPEMVALMSAAERKQLTVVHQALPKDIERVKVAYDKLGLKEEVVSSFFNDMPEQYVRADLMISRSGVNTLLEAAILGLPAIYVPHELADGHQKLNAEVAEKAGAAVVMEQAYLTPANLLVHVRGLWGDVARREAMSAAARDLARADAAEAVAKVVAEAVK